HEGLVLRDRDQVAIVRGRIVELTRQEFRLARSLVEHAPYPVPSADLLKALGRPRGRDTSVLRTHLRRLRQKLHPEIDVRSVAGEGFAIFGQWYRDEKVT